MNRDRDRPLYPVLYMFLLTALLSSVMIGFARLTEDRIQANQRLAFERAVLEALGLDLSGSSVDLHRRFTQGIRGPNASLPGAYVYMEAGQVRGYAIPVQGQGFWAPIRGVIGVAPDGRTLLGAAFYEQSETPGLGAEIAEPRFTGQFKDRRIAQEGPAFEIRPPAETLADHQVHAVTGATQTCTRLERFLNEALSQWRAAFAQEAQSP